MNYKNALKKVITEFNSAKLDLLGNNLIIAERTYVKNIKNSYQRTLS